MEKIKDDKFQKMLNHELRLITGGMQDCTCSTDTYGRDVSRRGNSAPLELLDNRVDTYNECGDLIRCCIYYHQPEK